MHSTKLQLGGLTFQHDQSGIHVYDDNTGRLLVVAPSSELLLRAREALKVAEASRDRSDRH
jgi:hypothetical protein